MIIIPARMASGRLPGKPLIELHGRPLLQHAIDAAKACCVPGPIVLTDEPRIDFLCERLGVRCFCDLKREYPTGTDRIAAYVKRGWRKENRPKHILNLQCDEPDLTPLDLALLFDAVRDHPEPVATLVCPLGPGSMSNRNAVKAVLDRDRAIYFTREFVDTTDVWEHVGAYAFKLDALLEYRRWPRADIELEEQLEQLRFVANCIPIRAVKLDRHVRSINTAKDVAAYNAVPH